MRVWSERAMALSPQQVVGSHGGVKFEMRDGKPVLVRTSTPSLWMTKLASRLAFSAAVR